MEDNPIMISEKLTRKVFKTINQHKAGGPDGISGKVLKTCFRELAYIFTTIYNKSLQQRTVPSKWKTSEIIPVPKKPHIKEMNDLRPVALTPIPMKCFERLILPYIKTPMSQHQDNLQFAYRGERSVEDAIVTFLDKIYRHLDKPRTYCRILYVDFSSAFNTIRSDIILRRLQAMGVHPNIVDWISSFLGNRTQYVRVNRTCSSTLITNVGAPQGCVLSPVLFTAYTDDCRAYDNATAIIKYADDTAILGLISNSDDETTYDDETKRFSKWCEENHLHLNVKKDKGDGH